MQFPKTIKVKRNKCGPYVLLTNVLSINQLILAIRSVEGYLPLKQAQHLCITEGDLINISKRLKMFF